MIFWDLIASKYARSGAGTNAFTFAVVSGDFPKTGIALPFGNRRVRAAALRELYLYKGKTLWSKTKINLLRIFNFSFVWSLVFKRQFAVSCNPAEENLFSFLASKIGSDEPVTFSVYVGSRKFILPLFAKKSGKMLGVAKIYFPGKESADYGENEAKILDYLQESSLSGFSFPRVIAKDYFKDSLVVILSSPSGLRRTKMVGKPHLDFLRQILEETGSETLFSQSGFYRNLEKEIGFLRSKISDGFNIVEYFYKQATENLVDKKFIFSLTKREFPFFEMMKFDSKFFVLDWEQAYFGFPPIFDFFSLLMSAGRFKKGDYAQLYKKNIIDLFFSKSTKFKKIFEEMLGFWKLERADTYWFFWLYLIDQLYIHLHVGHDLSAERIIAFFEKVRKNEAWFKNNWLGHKPNNNQ